MNVEKNKLYKMDAIKFMQTLPDESIDLAITSPPYTDVKDYDGAENKVGQDYIDWIIEIGKEIHRVIKNGGSFILNINDKVENGKRGLVIPKIWIGLVEKVGFNYIELYIWDKLGRSPHKSKSRAYDVFEYCFHFVKGIDFEFNYNAVRRPYTKSSLERFKRPVKEGFVGVHFHDKMKMVKPHKDGALPHNILNISSPTTYLGHPAPFPVELPEWFIKALTKPGDLIYDPFMGGGSTAVAAKRNGRYYIGSEINEKYIKVAEEKLKKMPKTLELFNEEKTCQQTIV